MSPLHRRSSVLALSLSLACEARGVAPEASGSARGGTAAAAAALAPPFADPPPVEQGAEHPFGARDIWNLRKIAGAVVSPDGTRVAYLVRTTDLEANKRRNDLWVVDVAGGEPRRLTRTAEEEQAPVWAADSSALHYLAKKDDAWGLWRIPVQGGAATRVRGFDADVSDLMAIPGGAGFLVTAQTYPDCPDLACTKERLARRGAAKHTGTAYDRLFVRHWDTWGDGRRSHPFWVPAGEGPVVDLVPGFDADAPSKPFGGSEELAVSPDGKTLVFTAKAPGTPEAWSTNFDLFAVDLPGGGVPRNLTQDNPAWDTHPRFAPDGANLAWLAMERPGYEADRYDVRARSWPTGEVRRLAPAWDRSPGELRFSADGKRLWATADDLGQVPIFSVDVASGKVEALPGKGATTWVGEARERIVWLRNDLERPDELWTSAADGSDARVLVSVNTDRLQGVRLGRPEQIEFRGAGGDTVRAYFLEPVGGPKPGTPLVLLVHGGPQGSMANRWHDRWNAQVYAGAGFAVLMVDFHGSTGYGQAFTDAIRGDWGGKPLADLDAGLAAVAQRFPWVAADRACALGASYGGYMVNWIAGQRPDRFRCLVNHDGLFDMRSMYYATEELWFPEWEQQGTYFEAAARHERHNPASHVQRWKTPMLVIHGSLDYRVNVEQGIATFTALQRRGVPSRFVHFPDENHWVLHPANSLQWHEEVLGWLARYLND